jgi:hypothetical protein
MKTTQNTALREAVRTLLPQGFTYGEIAEKTGFTRNAVAGVAFRLNIKTGRDNPPPKAGLEKIEVPNDPPLAGSTPTPLLETTGCRWPVEGGFCNCKVHKKLYCATHHKMAYRAAPDDLLNKLPFSTSNQKIQKAMHFYVQAGLVSYRKLDNGSYRYAMKTPPV